MFGYKLVKRSYTPADKCLEEIKDLLFPKLETQSGKDEENKDIKFHIDHAIDSNLDAALTDLREGNNDAITQRTIESACKKLYKIRELLEAHSIMDPNARYILVEDDKRFGEINAEEIVASEG